MVTRQQDHAPPVRVLHVIDGLGGGGCERLLWDIVRSSCPEQTVHRVVTIWPNAHNFVYADRLRRAGVYMPRLLHGSPSPSAGRGWRWLRRIPPLVWASRAVRRVRFHAAASMRVIAEYRDFRPDVIHGHTFYGLIYGLALKSLSGRPLVYMVPAPQAQIKMSGFGWIRYAYRWGHRWVDRFFIPPAYRSESTSLGVPSEKIVDFLLYVDGTTLAEAAGAAARHRADVRAGLGIPEEAPILLSVGRLDTEKGHEYAAAALPAILCRFPQIHWVILGDGKLRSSLEDLIGWLGIGNAVHFVGFRDEPVPFYAAADLYLRTTIFEGDNLSSALAVGVGLPAVGFDVGADNDLLRRAGHGLLVANRDTAALSAAVIALLSSVEDRRALGQRGLRYGKDHLTISAGVQPFLSAYLEFACRT